MDKHLSLAMKTPGSSAEESEEFLLQPSDLGKEGS